MRNLKQKTLGVWNRKLCLALDDKELGVLENLIVQLAKDYRFESIVDGYSWTLSVPRGSAPSFDIEKGGTHLFSKSLVKDVVDALQEVESLSSVLRAAQHVSIIPFAEDKYGYPYFLDEQEGFSRRKLTTKQLEYADRLYRNLAYSLGYRIIHDKYNHPLTDPGLIIYAARVARRRYPSKRSSSRRK